MLKRKFASKGLICRGVSASTTGTATVGGGGPAGVAVAVTVGVAAIVSVAVVATVAVIALAAVEVIIGPTGSERVMVGVTGWALIERSAGAPAILPVG